MSTTHLSCHVGARYSRSASRPASQPALSAAEATTGGEYDEDSAAAAGWGVGHAPEVTWALEAHRIYCWKGDGVWSLEAV